MKNLALIYSSFCPIYKPIKQMLEEIGLAFIGINQDAHYFNKEQKYTNSRTHFKYYFVQII
jgi:hypothetical protein